jgi:hypothetical protein
MTKNIADMEEQKIKRYLAYRILGNIDNFIAILFLFALLVNFAATGFNMSLLLPVFISFSILLYTNLTAVFARYVMVKGNFLRFKLKEWIKVNAYVTIIYASFVILIMTWGLLEKTSLQKVSSTMGVPENLLHNAIFILMACMVLLIVHVVLTFQYLKQFRDSFRDPEEPPAQ